MRLLVVPFVALAVAGVALACSSSTNAQCHAGADCVSGACSPEGQCLPAGQGADDASTTGPISTKPTGSTDPSDSGADAKPAGCVPNQDGTITREEVPLQAGLRATFKIGHDEAISTAGTTQANGTRMWDYSGALASDVTAIVETLPLAGKWYASSFTKGAYATTLRNDSTLLGVFETPAAAIQLLGVVSPDSAYPSTNLAYDPPVPVLKFPLKKGSTWTTDTSVSGTASGVTLLAPYTEKYESNADAEGELKTPLGTFHVIRVAVKLTRTIGFSTTTYRTFAFVSECYGTVASIASADNETNVEFTQAAEIRRVSP